MSEHPPCFTPSVRSAYTTSSRPSHQGRYNYPPSNIPTSHAPLSGPHSQTAQHETASGGSSRCGSRASGNSSQWNCRVHKPQLRNASSQGSRYRAANTTNAQEPADQASSSGSRSGQPFNTGSASRYHITTVRLNKDISPELLHSYGIRGPVRYLQACFPRPDSPSPDRANVERCRTLSPDPSPQSTGSGKGSSPARTSSRSTLKSGKLPSKGRSVLVPRSDTEALSGGSANKSKKRHRSKSPPRGLRGGKRRS